MEAGWSTRRVACQLCRSNCVVKRCWDQWIQEMSFTRGPGLGRSRQTSRREDPHIVKNARVQPTATLATIQAQVAPSIETAVSFRTIRSDESRFNLSSDDNRVRVWRFHGERMNPAFALQRRTAPRDGVMEWGAIAYNTWLTLNIDPWHLDGILQPTVLPLM
ncbi:transposable element Tcb2 transposase [Trichonephila clavipes]|nr:transposable element Tcb2 transposase [Trichonephila clavipes]